MLYKYFIPYNAHGVLSHAILEVSIVSADSMSISIWAEHVDSRHSKFTLYYA